MYRLRSYDHISLSLQEFINYTDTHGLLSCHSPGGRLVWPCSPNILVNEDNQVFKPKLLPPCPCSNLVGNLSEILTVCESTSSLLISAVPSFTASPSPSTSSESRCALIGMHNLQDRHFGGSGARFLRKATPWSKEALSSISNSPGIENMESKNSSSSNCS